MRTLYIDTPMGAAGDMLTAALIQLLDQDRMLDMLNDMGLEGVTFFCEKVVRAGIEANHMHVVINGQEEEAHDYHDHHHDHNHDHSHTHDHHEHEHHHHHTSLEEVHQIIDGLKVAESVKSEAKEVYDVIAQAESKAHGVQVSEVHFHEVGMLDAIADVVAVCLLIHELNVDRIIVSPVNVGFGRVRCAHGIVPVPAPATAYIIEGMPVYAGDIEGEMCTPTGAALLKHFATYFGRMPVMEIEASGYGAGNKDFAKAANVVIARLGVSDEATTRETEIVELTCNVDDMTGEEIGFAAEQLMAQGARDVSVQHIIMKKGRPGVIFRVMTTVDMAEDMTRALFKYTTTIGVRQTICSRWVLDRTECIYDTVLGKVKSKKTSGFGVEREKLEYDDLRRIALEQGMSIAQVKKAIGEELKQ